MEATLNVKLLTVYLGIYNGEAYLDSLLEQLLDQTFQNFDLLIVDNASIDSSLNKLELWKDKFLGRITIIRNETNLGGAGSLDLVLKNGGIKTPWFATLHQDDFYLKNHLEVLNNEIQNAGINVIAVCTLMRSMDEKGKAQETPPRAAWLVDSNTQVDDFLLNLRTQSLSFPSSAFHKDTFLRCSAPWHSPTFGDTETTLNLLTQGKLKYIQKETMLYRENPTSESHVINQLQSKIGAGLGLARIFSNGDFKNLLNLVPNNDRTGFCLEVYSCIDIRIGDSALADFLKLLFVEACFKTWGYTEDKSVSVGLDAYTAIDSKFTSELIARLSRMKPNSKNELLTRNLMELSNQFTTKLLTEFKASTPLSRILKRLFHLMPLNIRKQLFRFYVHLRAVKQPNYYWNAFWR
jgi:glycosyltransferase involved in cell wall biosynthesis